MDKINIVEAEQLKKDLPNFKVGDTVRVSVRIIEEEKTRSQVFEGVVISKKGAGLRASFTVRKISYGEGVERVFPLHSPSIEKISVTRTGKVRRSKLYFLRKRIGKKSKVKEKMEPSQPASL